ncbi:MAG: TonB-dependent receptor, partial [Parafilimonas sp.]
MIYLQKSILTRIFYILILCFLIVRSNAQTDSISSNKNNIHKTNYLLEGKITDAKTGNTLPGATILIHDLNKGTIAKADGSYKINNIPAGKYLVEVSYVGYASNVQTININETAEQNFMLEQTAVEQEEVIVTGVTSATRIKQSPQPVSVIKREDFLNTPATNTIDALTKLVPGVNAVSTGPAISKPFIRGLGYNRVLTINDGVRQEGQQWGDEHGIEIDDYSVQRVEVLKGPASLMYGSDAIAGVINIQS